MEKTLKVEELVKEYTSTTNEYISFAAKIVYANRIIESTAWNDDNQKIEINSPIRYLLYVYTLLNVYTNIEVHKESMLAEYDALTSAGLKDLIIAKIPESERKEFEYVLKMTVDDYYANHFETHAYIDSLVDRFRNIVENFFSPISEELVKGFDKLSSEEVANAITGAVAQMGNKEPEQGEKKPRAKKTTKKTPAKKTEE